MFDGLKNDLKEIGSALEARMSPQWEAAREVCRFRRGVGDWEFSYLAAAPGGQSGALLRLTRNGRSRFTISLNQPDIELGLWRDALHEVVINSDRRDVGWWLRVYLRLRGRRIECSRLVTQEESTFGRSSSDVDRYYIARLAGWREPCVLIVNTDTIKSSRSNKISGSSVRLLPGECRAMADGLRKMEGRT